MENYGYQQLQNNDNNSQSKKVYSFTEEQLVEIMERIYAALDAGRIETIEYNLFKYNWGRIRNNEYYKVLSLIKAIGRLQSECRSINNNQIIYIPKKSEIGYKVLKKITSLQSILGFDTDNNENHLSFPLPYNENEDMLDSGFTFFRKRVASMLGVVSYFLVYPFKNNDENRKISQTFFTLISKTKNPKIKQPDLKTPEKKFTVQGMEQIFIDESKKNKILSILENKGLMKLREGKVVEIDNLISEDPDTINEVQSKFKTNSGYAYAKNYASVLMFKTLDELEQVLKGRKILHPDYINGKKSGAFSRFKSVVNSKFVTASRAISKRVNTMFGVNLGMNGQVQTTNTEFKNDEFYKNMKKFLSLQDKSNIELFKEPQDIIKFLYLYLCFNEKLKQNIRNNLAQEDELLQEKFDAYINFIESMFLKIKTCSVYEAYGISIFALEKLYEIKAESVSNNYLNFNQLTVGFRNGFNQFGNVEEISFDLLIANIDSIIISARNFCSIVNYPDINRAARILADINKSVIGFDYKVVSSNIVSIPHLLGYKAVDLIDYIGSGLSYLSIHGAIQARKLAINLGTKGKEVVLQGVNQASRRLTTNTSNQENSVWSPEAPTRADLLPPKPPKPLKPLHLVGSTNNISETTQFTQDNHNSIPLPPPNHDSIPLPPPPRTVRQLEKLGTPLRSGQLPAHYYNNDNAGKSEKKPPPLPARPKPKDKVEKDSNDVGRQPRNGPQRKETQPKSGAVADAMKSLGLT